MWQDIIIAIISISFAFALLPQVIHGFKTKRKTITVSTALITVVGVYIMVFIYLTLKLYFSAIIQVINGTLWLILFIQSIAYKK